MLRLILKFKIILFIVFFFPSILMGQIEKANKQYKKENYQEALNLYQKSWNKNSKNDYVAFQMGNCYLALGDQLIAAEYFKKAFTINPNYKDAKLSYVNALIRAVEIERAEEFLNGYLKTYPHDEKAQKLLKTVVSIQEWHEKSLEEYMIDTLENMNSEFDDYAPSVFKNNILVFTSNRAEELKDFSGVQSYKKRNTNLYKIEFSKDSNNYVFNKPEILFKKLDIRNNIGPVSFTGDYNTCYFNSTNVNNKESIDTLSLKVFMMIYSGDKWGKPIGINLNSDKYSIRHPFISPDGKTLFFASDKPGGFGGLDIYYSEKKDSLFGEPINLGPIVNTTENEAFPTFTDSSLYFSSNGFIGYGNYDIFQVDNYLAPKEIKNLGDPINSSSDDLYIFFNSSNEGFFTSNRQDGVGGDDIYAFKRTIIDTSTTIVRGKVEFLNFPTGNTRVDLLDENNNVLQTIITNDDGEFVFSGLGVNTQYSFSVNYKNKSDTLYTRFYMLNSSGEKVMVLLQNVGGEYDFESLPAEEYDNLPLVVESKSLLTIQLKGQVYKDIVGDISRVTLYVLNDNNQVIAKGYSDDKGNFSFSELPPQDQYTLMLADPIEGAKIVILKDGNRIVEIDDLELSNVFLYVRLKPDEDFISLINESGEKVKIKLGENFKVDNIYYAYNSWDINEEAAISLNRLVSLLNLNPHIAIKLYSYTDSRGGDDFNLKLSQKRAESAKEYLMAHEIEPERINAIGLGETKLVNRCKNGVKCSEKEHAENRRTEFVIEKRQ